jgi:hypothetical protein
MAPSPDGPLAFQVKKTWPADDSRSRLCLGVASITTDTGTNPLYPYAVASARLCGRSRGHLGFAAQKGNHQLLLGYDYTLDCGTMLRADVVRGLTDGSRMTLYGLGALVPTKFGAVEGWVTRNIGGAADGGDATVFTLKLDWALKL